MDNQALFARLDQELASSIFVVRNPVLIGVEDGKIKSEKLAAILGQYVCFTAEIATLLGTASTHFHQRSAVWIELARNIGQERGSATGRVAHTDLLKSFLLRDLGIDAQRVVSHPATRRFLDGLTSGMAHLPFFALGQTYALEASATPELAIIVGPALNAYAAMVGREELIPARALHVDGCYSLPRIRTREQALAMSMADWFALHIVAFEVGHRDRLREAANAILIQADDRTLFRRGFFNTLGLMQHWWSALAAT